MEESFNTQNATPEEEPAYLHALKEFFIAGVSFREMLAAASSISRRDFCSRLLKITSLLYLKALMLETVELDETSDGEEELMLPTYVSEEEYAVVQHELESLLGERDYFLETLSEEMQFTDAPVTARISEYLADIYQPVGNLLGVVRDCNHVALPFALQRCRRLFEEYWGDRLLAVTRPLHAILFDGEAEHCEPTANDSTEQKVDLLIQQKIDAFLEGLEDDV